MSNIQTTQIALQYDLSKPQSLLNLATEMQRFCKEKNLTSTIQGKEFPNVEAWQFLGINLGVMPQILSVENTSTYRKKEVRFYVKNVGWQTKEIEEYSAVAKCQLVNISNGQIVGYAEAVCSNTESLKVHFEEYAVFSMAQTRAIAKAYRLSFGWIMKASGFEATPAEEMYEGKYDIPISETQKKEAVKPKKELTKEQTQLKTFLKENMISAFFNDNEIADYRIHFKDFANWSDLKVANEFEAIRNIVADRKNWLMHEQHAQNQSK